MQDFIWKCPTEIVFGYKMCDYVKKVIGQFGKKGMIISGKKSFERMNKVFSMDTLLTEMEVAFFSGIRPEAYIEDIRQGIMLARKVHPDWIIAVGGGSVIDVAKVIALAALSDTDVEDIVNGKGECVHSLPLICMPTVIGSGAEISRGCVVHIANKKKAFSHDLLRPVLCYIIPEVFGSLSKQQILSGGTDAIVHVLERYFTTDLDNDFTDRYSAAIVACLIDSMKKILKGDCSIGTYAQMEMASMHANMGLAACGRMSDNACHTIEHVLGGRFQLPHAYGIVIVLMQWIRIAWKRNPLRISRLYENIEGNKIVDFEHILQQAEMVYKGNGIPIRLREIIDINSEDIDNLADCLTDMGRKKIGRYIELDRADLVYLLSACS